MLSSFCQPLILKPTRFHEKTAPSLIGNIFMNSIDPSTISGNLIDKISDYLPNFAFFGIQLSKNKHQNNTTCRDYRNFNKEAYIQEAKQINFCDDTNHNSEVNSNYEHFQNKFLELLNKHAHLRSKSKRLKRQERKPWITEGIIIIYYNREESWLYKQKSFSAS